MTNTLIIALNSAHRFAGSTRGILFLVIYGIFWYQVFTRLYSGVATIAADEATAETVGSVLAWFDLDQLITLFSHYPATLVAYFYIALSVMPLFAIWAANDQTAGDLDTRYIRFLLPRAARREIYAGRFIGTLFCFAVVQTLVTLSAITVSIQVDQKTIQDVLQYGLAINSLLILYALAFVTLMSLMTAATASTAIATLVAFSSYALIISIVPVLEVRYPQFQYLIYLLPGAFKSALLGTGVAIAVGGLLLQSTCYLLLGSLVFVKRDV